MRWWQWSRRRLGWAQWLALLVAVALASFWGGARWGSARAGRAYTGVSAPKAPALPGNLAAASQPAGEALPPRPLPPPGEFQTQSALVLVCNELVPCFPQIFKEVVAATWRSVPVVCLVANEAEQQVALALLRDADLPETAVTFALAQLDTMWVRDYGPIFVKQTDGAVYAVDLDYSPVDEVMEVRWRDNNAPRQLGDMLGLPVLAVALRAGSGNLLSNGEGLCVTTTALLRENLDRGYDAEKIHSLLTGTFGYSRWLCLRELEGERTGHADMFVTFLAPDVAVVAQMDAAEDPTNARILDEAAEQLARQQTSRGPVRVFRIPMPAPENGMWRSYTNVIFANRTLLVPTFIGADAPMQDRALSLYCRLLPGWKVIPVNSDGLVPSDGLLHCITLNVPNYVGLSRMEKRKGRLMDFDFGQRHLSPPFGRGGRLDAIIPPPRLNGGDQNVPFGLDANLPQQ